jgi:hypothetical protein
MLRFNIVANVCVRAHERGPCLKLATIIAIIPELNHLSTETKLFCIFQPKLQPPGRSEVTN